MVSNIKKVSAIIVATFMLLAMSAFFSLEVNALTSKTYEQNGITVVSNLDLNKGSEAFLPTGNGTALNLHLDISVGNDSELKYFTLMGGYYNYDKPISGTSASMDFELKACGVYKLKIRASDDKEFYKEFLVWPKAPSKNIEILTTNDKICIDTYMMNKTEYGDNLYVAIGDSYYLLNLGKKMNDNLYIPAEPNKSYTLKLCGCCIIDGANYKSQNPTTITVKTGPKTKPAIKSVKISKVKVSKPYNYHWNSSGQWVPYYKTSWTTTITLKKQIKGIAGVEISDGYNAYYAKGSKKAYTVKMSIVSEGFNHKGWTHNFNLSTYSDKSKTYMAYGPLSNTKKAKIK